MSSGAPISTSDFDGGLDDDNSSLARDSLYARYVKRGLDVLLSLLFLLLFWWLLLILALLVRVKLGSPVLFKQQRPGKDGKLFSIYKFRTMNDARGADGKLLPDLKRLTPFGRKLRDSSLDELPEIFNALNGTMSLVGPRPLLEAYLPLYNDLQRHRHDVRPGITGYAQVHGRNATSWEQRFEYDVYYVEHVSFVLDFKIVMGTIGTVFSHADVDSEGARDKTVTMEPFMGSEKE